MAIKKNISIPGEKKDFGDFPKIDLPDIEKKAKTDAAIEAHVTPDNLPSCLYKLDHSLSEFQRREKDRAQTYFHECQQKISNYIHAFDTKVIKTALLGTTKNNSSLNLDEEENILDDYHRNFLREKNNFINFRREHSRHLLPNHADPDETKTQKFVLIALIVIELFMNLGILQAGGATDITSAFAISAAQTMWNIMGCYLIGKMVIGQIIYSPDVIKKIGFSLFAIFQFYTVALVNSNMGYFRQAIVNAADDEEAILGGAKILNNTQLAFWENFGTLEITSLLAVLVGMVFAFIAYIDGFKSDDPYPGYGDVYRKMIRHKKMINKKIRDINSQWTHNLSLFHKKASQMAKDAVDAINNWSQEINTIEQVRDDYLELITRLNERFEKAISAYEAMYNRFVKGKSINLKQVSLFKKDQFDMNKEFSDTKEFFMNDNQRLKEEDAKKLKFGKDMEAVEKDLEKTNQATTERLKKLSNKYDTTFD